MLPNLVSLVPDAEIYFIKSYVKNADELFDLLNDNTKFRKHELYFYDQTKKEITVGKQSRASYWFGMYAQSAGNPNQIIIDKDTNQPIRMPCDFVEPYEFPVPILELKQKIESEFDVEFNSCLVGKFDSPKDKIGFHSDCSNNMGSNPFVGSVSFGKSRKFYLKPVAKSSQKITILLEHGDLLLMRDKSNQNYLHMVPVDPDCNEQNCRINLTFRNYNYDQFEIDWTLANTK